MQLPRPAPTCPGVADDAPRGHQRGVAEADPVVGHRRARGYPRPAGRSGAEGTQRPLGSAPPTLPLGRAVPARRPAPVCRGGEGTGDSERGVSEGSRAAVKGLVRIPMFNKAACEGAPKQRGSHALGTTGSTVPAATHMAQG